MSDYITLREQALEANLEIPKRGLAIYTWGNVSAFDSSAAVFAIKPSGVSYGALNADSMVVVDLEGRIVWGTLRPSSDTETHRCLYRSFAGIGGITHTHSTFATAWAQAGRGVPVFGTTHADHGAEEIPCTGFLTEAAVQSAYEWETGALIAGTFSTLKKNPSYMQMALVAGHGPFTWGTDAAQSVYHAAVLEEICKIACFTLQINPGTPVLPAHIINKHWERKHGSQAYYGQNISLK
jgi:L-ribulose-5-phosphate 4-epimerase